MAQDDQINIRIGVTGAEEARGQISGLSDAFTLLHGGLLTGVGTFQSWIVSANQAIGLVQQLVGGFQMLLQPVEQVGQALLNVAQQMDAIVGISGAVTSTIGQAFAQTAFQLNEQTEKNFFNWAYLYGGPAQGGVPIAEQLARWSQKASLSMPFTRQDLMGAITTLAVMPGMTPSKEETDLALLSDVASTQGRQGLTLQWAAMAALRGGEGYGRMLLMDLNLSEATMKKYGYDRTNPATFFPALQAYESARQGGHYSPGSIGQSISTETFWGAQTSFVDRIQNTLLQLGGWNNNATTLTGDVQKGSVFGILKQDLVDVSTWMDAHSQQLQQLADVAGRFFGGITGGATTIFGGFFNALGSSGIGTDILTAMSDFARFMAQPDTQAALKSLGDALGHVASSGLGDVFLAGQAFLDGLSKSGIGQAGLGQLKDLGDWLADPEHQKAIRDFFDNIGQLAGRDIPDLTHKVGDLVSTLGQLTGFFGEIGGIIGSLNDLWQKMGDLMAHLADEFTKFTGIKLADPLQTLKSSIGDSVKFLGDFVKLMDDIANGRWDAAKSDVQSLGGDFGSLITEGMPTWTGGGASGGGGTGVAGGTKIGSLINVTTGTYGTHAGAAIAGALANVSQTQGKTAATDFTSTYITTAQTLMSQQQTSDAIVQPFVTSLQRSIQNGSDMLATTLLQVIQQETQKQLAAALASRDALGNLDGRAPGGQRFGAHFGF